MAAATAIADRLSPGSPTPTPARCVEISPSALAKLRDEDRQLVDRVFSEPTEFVDHPSFHHRGAERKLFGTTAVFDSNVSTRFTAAATVIRDTCLDTCAPTLTTEQEQLLFKRMNYGRWQVYQILQNCDGRKLTYSTIRTLLGWQRRALEARGEIVRLNMPLVLAMAKRTRLASVDYNDLVSEGNMALLRSVEKFDCSRGYKFSTYACRAILKSFSRVAMRMARYRCRFVVEYDPLLEKSDFLERKRERVEDECVSELRHILESNAADLSDIERTVIRERFALWAADPEGAAPKTLEQVGLLIGLTKERVRQIQNKALQKIRIALEEVVLVA